MDGVREDWVLHLLLSRTAVSGLVVNRLIFHIFEPYKVRSVPVGPGYVDHCYNPCTEQFYFLSI